ncbi:MAG: hypothetical protein HQ568_09920 [Calditrichaeota bacterium]|nr:hypothetical protein [Calditrichota bacterium]
MAASKPINYAEWEQKEHDWTGKAFYFVNMTCVFSKPLVLGSKMEQLNREVRQAGYKIIDTSILILAEAFSGKVMIEVEKQDIMDAQILHFEDKTQAYTTVYRGSPGGLSKGMKSLAEIVASRRGMSPRSIYYRYVDPDSADYKTIMFAVL